MLGAQQTAAPGQPAAHSRPTADSPPPPQRTAHRLWPLGGALPSALLLWPPDLTSSTGTRPPRKAILGAPAYHQPRHVLITYKQCASEHAFACRLCHQLASPLLLVAGRARSDFLRYQLLIAAALTTASFTLNYCVWLYIRPAWELTSDGCFESR